MSEPDPSFDDSGLGEPADFEQHELRAVDSSRIAEWMTATKQRHFTGADGQIIGVWDGCLLTFSIAGKGTVLQIRGQLNRQIAIERREEMIALINDRHARAVWPKAFLMVLDDGSMRLAADHATIIAHGLSDHQLDRAIRVALSGILTLFKQIATAYPDPLAHPPEAS